MPRASIIVPAYNTLRSLPETIESLLAQTFSDYEVIVVDDGSSDGTSDWVLSQSDPRLRLVRQVNRGLAGARNGGIAAARGEYVGFCDGDDLWEPQKLAAHVAHLDTNPEVGVSYAGSILIDADGRDLGLAQRPKLDGITPRDVLLRNPIGNGSAPVIRRACLDDIAFRPVGEDRDWWFDESFRQSEDIECWIRITLTTRWTIAGIPGQLTRYRIIATGLSANLDRQFATWERVAARVRDLAPEFAHAHLAAARAYQLRYLARRAVSLGDGRASLVLAVRALRSSIRPFFDEPIKTGITIAAAAVLVLGGRGIVDWAMGARLA